MKDKIPVLVTLDVHPVDGIDACLESTLDRLEAHGIKSTMFVTASVYEAFPDLAKRVMDAGHQIGSHGLIHNDKPVNGYLAERYDLLDEPDQRRFFEETAVKAREILGQDLTAFRSPCFGISGTTIRLLEEFGFRSDFSVNSQRVDLLTAAPFSFNHMLAPRKPYHPSVNDPFRRGDSGIWEIPLSAFVLPFAVMTLITFRFGPTKMFFDALYREAKQTGKPIVYMAHPEEYTPEGTTYTIPLKDLTLKDFLPLKGRGIRARQAIRMGDPKKIFDCHERLMEYMTSFDDLEFVTADEYVSSWL